MSSPRSEDTAAPGGTTPVGATDAELAALLTGWLPTQRWFSGKGETLTGVGLQARNVLARALPSATGGPLDVEQVLIEVDTAHGALRYQLWVGWHSADGPEAHLAAVIGEAGGLQAVDALHNPAVTSLVLQHIAQGTDLGPLRCRPEPDAEIDVEANGFVIGAEQSNTSVVFGNSAILKVFRRLEPGSNPDAEVHRALHRAGSTHVAVPLGEITGPLDGQDTTMGLLTRFYANSAEGWSMAVSSVRDLMAEGDLRADEVGGDLAAESYRLGEAVAAVHADLAGAFGTQTADNAELRRTLDTMAGEARRAAEQAPSLAPLLPGILDVFALAGEHAAGMNLQRIHGDLHLGQTLRTLTGWLIIDFEGEPSKSLEHRRALHSPLKDVAGMLRSYDYAGHQPLVGARPDAQHAYRAAEWTARNSTAFCDGYTAVLGYDPRQAGAVLRAFELEKAVYEVVYEHGHRPSWEAIPLQAVNRLVHAGGKS
ncbi:phosphotransferase [Nakamurella flavida]|uniref:Maltokinase n=1 Tax=Nakamurella flavida TaxID=363630 RepID=A0A938YK49_9ACTN|nr:phosphotransferase [Nakamurella flavida]MBM9476178.1 phosphotransferase [Nakamurella flavida]MDP9777077.1 maltokinase [Nakamurella flavida]